MDVNVDIYEDIKNELRKTLIDFTVNTNKNINDDDFWYSLNERLLSCYEGTNIPESTQRKLNKYIFDIAPDIFYNRKFILKIEEIKKIELEIAKLKDNIFDISQEGVTIITEIENVEKYINFEDINNFILSSGGVEVSPNTLSKWSSKGLLGDQFTEKDICPNSFENHRTVYFLKDKVLEFLINEGKVEPKYQILDNIEVGTVLDYVITKDNKIGYYCRDLDTGRETII